jgi:hypothetical protein
MEIWAGHAHNPIAAPSGERSTRPAGQPDFSDWAKDRPQNAVTKSRSGRSRLKWIAAGLAFGIGVVLPLL